MARRKNDYLFIPQRRRNHTGMILLILLLFAVTIAGALVVNHASNQRVVLAAEKVHIMGLDKGFEGFSVLFISDLEAAEIGSDTAQWKKLLQGKTFHAVVLGGDMVGPSGNYEPLLSLIHTLTTLREGVPVFFIAGDDDPEPILSTARGTPKVRAAWVEAAEAAGGVYLDVPMSVTFGKKTVWFSPQYLYEVDVEGMLGSLMKQRELMEEQGTQYDAEGGAIYRALNYRIEVYQRTSMALKTMKEGDLQIAVNHVPLDVDYIRESIEWADTDKIYNFRNISLLLSGHYCGGQWRLPGGKALYVPEMGWFPDGSRIVGMQRINSLNEYISPGLSYSRAYPIKGRLFNPPTATIISYTARFE